MWIDARTSSKVLSEFVLGRAAHVTRRRTVRQSIMELEGAALRSAPPAKEPRTPVLMLLRDAEPYVRQSLPVMWDSVVRALRNRELPPPRLYVYENNSKDGTCRALGEFQRKHSGSVVVCSDRCPPELCPQGKPRSTTRCAPMAAMRNALRVLAMRDIKATPVTIALDADIWISGADVQQLLIAAAEPDVDIATANTMMGSTHYFDTYALVLEHEDPRLIYGRIDCPLSTCTECTSRRAQGIYSAPRDTLKAIPDRLRVTSAFGGCAALTQHTLVRPEPWRSAENLCEHVRFCAGYHTVIVGSAAARWVGKYSADRARDLDGWVQQRDGIEALKMRKAHASTPSAPLAVSRKRRAVQGRGKPRAPFPVIVSLTTIPARAHKIDRVIDSLLNRQLVEPTAVVVNLPRHYNSPSLGTIHEPPRAWQARGGTALIVNRDCSDLGPATKLVGLAGHPIVRRHPDALIVYLDDDHIAVPSLVREHVLAHQRDSGRVWCGRGERLTHHPFVRKVVDTKDPVQLASGVGSVSVRLRDLDLGGLAEWVHTLPPKTWFSDDLLFGHWYVKRSLNIHILGAKKMLEAIPVSGDATALHKGKREDCRQETSDRYIWVLEELGLYGSFPPTNPTKALVQPPKCVMHKPKVAAPPKKAVVVRRRRFG